MKRPARIAAICLTIGGGAVTLLLWSKLKLVAGIPRTVYADPESEENGGSAKNAAGESVIDVPSNPDESRDAVEQLDPTSK